MPPKNKGGDAEALPRFGRPGNNLKMGIVGLPNVGKSSLFNLLGESAEAAAENYPFCTIEPNTARCAVPDKRYKQLCDIWNPPSKYPAFLHLVDIAGLIKGASEGVRTCTGSRKVSPGRKSSLPGVLLTIFFFFFRLD
jgi:obg-like ATPase 1